MDVILNSSSIQNQGKTCSSVLFTMLLMEKIFSNWKERQTDKQESNITLLALHGLVPSSSTAKTQFLNN